MNLNTLPEKEMQEYYQQELRRLSMVASANENGVAFCHLDGVVFWANEGYSKLTGYGKDEVNGKTPLELGLGPLSNRKVLRGMVDDFHHCRNFDVEVIHYRKDGTWFWGRIKGQVIPDDSGKLVQYFSIIEDITDRKNAEAALIEARESAEESSHAKEIFLANMSHEIRTPMNAILGMTRQLQKTELKDKQKNYLDTIHSAAENLLVIINDILDISKIEAGHLSLEEIGFRMQDVLTRVNSVMLHKAEEKGLRLSCSVADDVAPILKGDPYRLNQVLLNLVSNALKFTEQGAVTISCYTKEIKKGFQTIYLTVSDTGIGMEPEFIRHLFQKFLQEDKTIARKYGGTGLGMSICKQLVALMDGKIEVKSEKGKGTSIILSIPFEIGNEADLPVKEDVPIDSGLLKNKRILLVEDNELNRLVAVTVLNNYGAIVTEVADGMEAVAAVKKDFYDLVLMDVQMPVMDGREATRAIRKDVNKKIPIIALTANAIKGEMEICLAAGMDDYVTKPFEEDHLIKVICQWLCKERSVPAETEHYGPLIPLYSLDKIKKMAHGDNEFIRKVLQLSVEQIPISMREIKAAYSASHFETIKRATHHIKPIFDTLCVDVLQKEINEVESLAAENRSSGRLEELIMHLDGIASIVTAGIQAVLSRTPFFDSKFA